MAMDGLESYCRAVDKLPEQCRRVYLLRKVHGLSHKDIAARLDITVRSVERHLQKGVVKCRAYMREEDGVDVKVGSQNSVANLRKERVK
jgi:DNA-directed RNA polymerase specialized sigma24 family protein